MSERIFSGESSKKFWNAIHKSGAKILYDYGCKAQELEAINADMLEALKVVYEGSLNELQNYCIKNKIVGYLSYFREPPLRMLIIRAIITKAEEEK